MAEITIKLKDLSSGGVEVIATPSFETMMKMHASGEDLTSAHAYALYAVRCIREEAKNKSSTTLIQVPKIGRI